MSGDSTSLPKVKARLEELGVEPRESLGQHFLIDDETVATLARTVSPGSLVIEVGAGVGQLTEALAGRAGRVIAIEIDRRFEPVLAQVAKDCQNVEVVFGDALAVDFHRYIPKTDQKAQVVASLPFHISEPFWQKIVDLPLSSITLMVGDRSAGAITAQSEESPYFGQLTLLAQTFFDVNLLAEVKKSQFYPVPRTNAAIVRLLPRKEPEFRADRRLFLFRRLFLTAQKSPLIKNVLKEGLIEANQLTQNQARAIIAKMNLPPEVLDKPFGQLNNDDLKVLSRALRP